MSLMVTVVTTLIAKNATEPTITGAVTSRANITVIETSVTKTTKPATETATVVTWRTMYRGRLVSIAAFVSHINAATEVNVTIE